MKNEQKQMSRLVFKIMTLIMSIRKIFRNIDDEVRYAGIKPGDYILDFGCGLGFNAIPAAKIVGSKGKVFALDIHKQAIEIVIKKTKNYEFKNIETILSDCNTGLKDNTINVVYLHNTLPLIKNKKGVLNEISRVLKIRGKLSYMSRFGSRIMGKYTMKDEKLKEYLKTEYKFELIKSKNRHFIFEKNN